MSTTRNRPVLALAAIPLLGLAASGAEPLARRPLPKFERIVIDDNFPGGYQVEVADVNGDGKPDVVALGGGTCVWYENPSWTRRIITTPAQTPGIISSATRDLDGDGKAEVAIAYEFAMNEPTKGKLLLARQGEGLDAPWVVDPIGEVASIHRLRWLHFSRAAASVPPKAGLPVDANDHEVTHLVVAPIFGRTATAPLFNQEPASIHLFSPGASGKGFFSRSQAQGGLGGVGSSRPQGPAPGPVHRPGGVGGVGSGVSSLDRGNLGSFTPIISSGRTDFRLKLGPTRLLAKAPILHAIDVVEPLAEGGLPAILGASNLGVTCYEPSLGGGAIAWRSRALVPGAPGDSPKKGASEVHLGRLAAGRRFLATVEPWHGTDVAIYVSESLDPLEFGPRTVIDSTLKEGHALWVADVDGDGDDEVFAGYRGPGTSVLAYDFDGKTWNRTVLDPAIAAQDLRGGDLDGDGSPDVVAIGGKTHNVIWYRPIREPAAP